MRLLGDLVADGVLCILYIALNAGLNFVNRWALGVHGFAFPLTLTSAHMLLNPVLLAPMMLLAESYRSKHGAVVSGNWRALLAIATLNGIQISLNNSSLVHIELSMNQVVRAMMPVFVAAFQTCRGAPPALDQMMVLLFICTGVILVVYQPSAMTGEVTGIAYVTSSVSMQAAQMVFAGGLLAAKLDSFQITFYTSPPALLALAGPALWIEGRAFGAYLAERPGVAAAVLVGTCVLAVVYNVVMFQTIRRLSPIGSSVLGNVKIVAILLLSSVLMGEMQNWKRHQFAGCVITFVGAALYSAMKLRGAKTAGHAPAGKKD